MMKQITENLNVSPDENDIIDELTSIIGGWGETSEKQDILGLINNYTNNKSLYEEVKTLGDVNWDKYKASGYEGSSMDYRDEMILPDKTFYSIVELLVREKELEEWEGMAGTDALTYFENMRLKAISPISKLFGKTFDESQTTNLDSMLNKIYWAVIDNYEDIKSGEIDEFKYLTVRETKMYKVDLSENMQEHRTYTWDIRILGYDKEDVISAVESNADGDYDPWEYDYEISDEEIYDRDGVEIDNIEEEIIKEQYNSPNFTRQNSEATSEGEYPEKVIDKLDIIIMERIIKDYSVKEIETLSQTHWQELHELDNLLKLFGKRGELKLAKQYVQFLWDNNTMSPHADLQQYIGDKLPALKKFTFKVKWTDINTYFMSGDIVVYDTDYAVAACDVVSYIYDYDVLNENSEYEDGDTEGRVVVESRIGDKKVYDDEDLNKDDDKYNPYKDC